MGVVIPGQSDSFTLELPVVQTVLDRTGHDKSGILKNIQYNHNVTLISQKGRGFTLIELLVVLVVMGIALGMVGLQLMPDKQAPLREESARLALLLENAGMEARASGRSLAWSGEKGSYRFYNKNDYGDWVRIDDDTMFRPRNLADGVNINEVTVEEQPLKPGEYLILNAYTYAVPFRIRLGSEFGSATVTGKSTGDVTATLDGQPASSAP